LGYRPSRARSSIDSYALRLDNQAAKADTRPPPSRGSSLGQLARVAQQLGHSPRMCLDTYAGVFQDFDPARRLPAESAIAEARGGPAVWSQPVAALHKRRADLECPADGRLQDVSRGRPTAWDVARMPLSRSQHQARHLEAG
jgi:hypothetical protein